MPVDGIDVRFLKKLRQLLRKQVKKGKRFILIAGGGSTARAYMQAANKVTRLTHEDMDWLGIHSTRLNGHLLRTILRDIAHPEMIKNPERKIRWKEPILVAAGWKPGRSTDEIAVRMASAYDASHVINLTNIERVYNKDPKKFPDAVPYDQMSWKEFRKLVGNRWTPGANAPFDPIASRLAQKLGMTVTVAKGDELKNLEAILEGRHFKGTTLS